MLSINEFLNFIDFQSYVIESISQIKESQQLVNAKLDILMSREVQSRPICESCLPEMQFNTHQELLVYDQRVSEDEALKNTVVSVE